MNTYIRLLVTVLSAIWLNIATLFAQHGFNIQQLDNSYGLSNSSVTTLYRDTDNLLWVGTWDGLNMYDGNDFKVYNYDGESRDEGLGSNVIQGISQGSRNYIWINTVGGISRLEKHTGKLSKYFYDSSLRKRITEKEFELTANRKGLVFCYSLNEGLNKFDYASDKFVKLNIGDYKILKLHVDSSGLLWVLTDRKEVLVFENQPSLKLKHVYKSNQGITNFHTSYHSTFIESNNKLYKVGTKFDVTRIPGTFSRLTSIANYKSHYFILSSGSGLKVFNNLFEPSSFLQDQLRGLEKVKVTSLSSSPAVLWLGTDGKGLIKIYSKESIFETVGKEKSLLEKPVRSFNYVNGALWVGTKGQGILQIRNFEANTKQWDITYLNTLNGLSDNSVFNICKTRKYVYIGTDGRGINVVDIARNKLYSWDKIQGTEKLPGFSSVYKILEDRNGSLWLGTSGSGLINVSFSADSKGNIAVKAFKQFLSETSAGLANDIIYDLASNDDRYLWIACRYNGLSVYDKLEGTFRTFRAFSYHGSLSNNDILSLRHTPDGGLWIGTSYGLNYLPKSQMREEKPLFDKFTMNEGLPNNTIHGIEQYADNIWLSTNRGLAKLNVTSRMISSYYDKDGLQSNEFSDGAVWKADNGRLFFGGVNGFTYFFSQRLAQSESDVRLILSKLEIGGEPVNEKRVQVLGNKGYEVPYYTTKRELNFFRLVIKPITHRGFVEENINYKLEGLDRRWSFTGDKREISYTNVPPGRYTLLVRWKDGSGKWKNTVAVLTLQVKQYVWLSGYALAGYFLIIGLSIYGVFVYRKNRLRMKYKLAMEYELRQKDEAMHQQQLNFFTNIAHELQTPLTLIVGSIEFFLSSKHKKNISGNESNYFLSVVYHHSIRLTYLVQQLLEFRKSEAGHLQKHENYVDVSKMLNTLSLLFRAESERQNKSYCIEVEEGIAGFIDKDKLEKILFNLLSNAFKYTKAGDRITFTAKRAGADPNVLIRVSNSGSKITAEEAMYVFGRFYTANQSDSGTGIGLAFAQELAKLIDSKIQVSVCDGVIVFELKVLIKESSDTAPENEVVTSAPSSLYKPLLKHYDLPAIKGSDEENKTSLISELHEAKAGTVLIVEDDPELRYLLHQILNELYTVYEASNGEEALSVIAVNPPDIIVSDIMMPGMNGYQLCKTIKNTPATSQIPFIILSAKSEQTSKQDGYMLGADAYISKPFDTSYLLLRIQKLLDNRNKSQNIIKDQNLNNFFIDLDIADLDKKFLEDILKVIEERLDDTGLNASAIESGLAISKMQLYRKLKALTGMTPSEFIKRVRLKFAAEMLLTSKYTVSEIFYKTGFNSKSYFFREFKKVYQCAPSEYRLKHNEPSL